MLRRYIGEEGAISAGVLEVDDPGAAAIEVTGPAHGR